MEREAFRLTLVRPGLASALDGAQVRIDSVAPLGATTMGWIADLERDEEPAILQRDWTALRITDPVELHRDVAHGPAVLFNVRRLLDPGWGPENRPALDQLVRMAAQWIYESPAELEDGLRVKTPAPEFLRGLSHRIQLTRVLAHRIIGRGFPWSAQFDLMRGARHVLVLARRRLKHRVAALTDDLEAAQNRPGCEWLRLWRHARQLHDKRMCSEEALGYARALRAFEDQEELRDKALNRIAPDTLAAWLRLRGDISVIPGTTHLHTDSAKDAEGELDKSWLPEAKLPGKLDAIMRRAGWALDPK